MAAGKGQWFIQVGLLVGWLGGGCGAPAPESQREEHSDQREGVDGEALDTESAAAGASTPSGGVRAGTVGPGPLPEPPPPDEPGASGCDELPPVVPEAPSDWRSTQRSGTRYLNCHGSAADGTGAVITSRTFYDYHNWAFDGFAQGGLAWSAYFVSDTFEPHGQAGGFLSFSQWGNYYLSYLDSRTWQFTHHPPEPYASLERVAEDPRGGLRALFPDGVLKAYGPTGETLWSTSLPLSHHVRAMGVDAQGHTLLVLNAPSDKKGAGGTSVQGLWVDVLGRPGTPFLVRVQSPVSSLELVPQAKQGLFLGITDGTKKTWTAFAPLATHASPAPTWLSSDAERPLVRLPSGNGYLRWAQPLPCQHEAELFSSSGNSCGKTRFPAIHPTSQGRCGTMKVGPDGTVVETFPREADDYYPDFPYFCRVRWWPALFKH